MSTEKSKVGKSKLFLIDTRLSKQKIGKPKESTPSSLKKMPSSATQRKLELLNSISEFVLIDHTKNPSSTCDKHLGQKVGSFVTQASHIFYKGSKRFSQCSNCAFKSAIKDFSTILDPLLNKQEKYKRITSEQFLMRIDLFSSCLTNNLGRNKRKINENLQRYESDQFKIKTFHEHLTNILAELFDK